MKSKELENQNLKNLVEPTKALVKEALGRLGLRDEHGRERKPLRSIIAYFLTREGKILRIAWLSFGDEEITEQAAGLNPYVCGLFFKRYRNEDEEPELKIQIPRSVECVDQQTIAPLRNEGITPGKEGITPRLLNSLTEELRESELICVIGAPEREKPKETPQKFLYYAREFDSPTPISPEILGKKGANLCEMKRLNLPVPDGFTLTTEAWKRFNQEGRLPEEIWKKVLAQLETLQKKTNKKFGDPDNPLIVSVRSGAFWSMPGMMETILNIGLNEENLRGLAERVGLECAQDSYTRLKEMFEKKTGQELPQDPWRQLKLAIEAVFASWNSKKAVEYRKFSGIPDDAGTAVTIQEMVFGNIPDGKSGTGVFFTRNPLTGEKEIFGNFVWCGQGPDVVTPRGKPGEIPPQLRDKLGEYAEILEAHFRSPQDVEFTVQKGTIFLLQTREAKLDPLATIKATVEMGEEGIISQEEARKRIAPYIDYLSHEVFSPQALKEARKKGRRFTKGIPVSFGDITGQVVLNPEEAQKISYKGGNPILFCDSLDLGEISSFPFTGVVASIGTSTSHPGTLMRRREIPAIFGADFRINQEGGVITSDGEEIRSGEWVSISGNSGEVFRGKIEQKVRPKVPFWLRVFLEQRRRLKESPWRQFSFSEEMLENFRVKAEALVLQVSRWRTPKAQITEILNGLLPEISIESKVIEASDKEGIAQAIKEALREGFSVYPRSCYPGKVKTPWCRGPQKEEEIDLFLHDPEYGGLAKWEEDDPNIEAVIIAKDPKGKLDPNLRREHFAFAISCEGRQITINLLLNTPHLRDMGKVNPEELIRIIAQLNPENPSRLGEIIIEYGENYQDDPYAQRVAEVLEKRVFQEWWRKFNLPEVMAILEENFGLWALEVQGRMKERKRLAWIKVYDAKAQKEG